MKKLGYLAILTIAVALGFGLATVMPAMAAPAVASVTETAFGTDETNHDVNMPATVNQGDLLIVVFANDGSASVITPSGWSLLASNANGNQVRISVYYEISAGTEGGTTVNFVTSAAEQAAAQVYRITSWHGTTPPEISTAATSTDTIPDPTSLDPTGWDVTNTLWMAVAGQDRGDQAGTTAYPVNYTDGTSTLSSNSNQGCRILSARRMLIAAGEDPSTFTVPAPEQWVAFTVAIRPASYALTTSITEGGSVTTPGEGVFTYDAGAVIDLTATPGRGYRFVEWTGDVGTIEDINAATTTITMDGDYTIAPEFVEQYELTVPGTEGGSVTTPGEGVFTYDAGTVIDLTATPGQGYRFLEWTGDVGTIEDINAGTTTITMDGDYTIAPEFVKQYDLTISETEGGSVTVPGEGVFTYDEGIVVDLVASPGEGYDFVEWTGDVGTIADVYASETTITLNGAYSVTADFEEVPPPPVYPTLTTEAATDIACDSVVLNMNYTVGNFSSVQIRFAYKESAGLVWSNTDWVFKSAPGTYAVILSGLASNTQYDFKAELRHDGTVVEIEGTVLQFTTGTPPPWGAGGGCFIATAAYGTPSARQIDVLRDFRDDVLLKNTVGSQFVALYYRFSPPIANIIAGNEILRTLIRELLIDPIVWLVKATGDIWQN